MPIFVPEPKKYKYISTRRRGRRRLYALIIVVTIAALAATAFVVTGLNHS
jgi:hypothetical protein